MTAEFSHLDQRNQPAMVDISHKSHTPRQAIAQAIIQLPAKFKPYCNKQDLTTQKGAVIQTAIIAGTMAVKKTADLIPFCHPLPISACKFTYDIQEAGNYLLIVLRCRVKTIAATGVEMEALCGVTIASLTIYDMCKSISSEIVIQETKLIAKSGGKQNITEYPIYGLVLTGGRSKRMGQDKALLPFHNRPHALYLYELLQTYCQQVFLSARANQWQGTVLANLPILVDQFASVGPITGLLTAFSHFPKVNWLVVACDLANLQPSTIEKLLANFSEEAIATCYRNPAGFPEALCAIYTPSALPILQNAFAQQQYCPVKILETVDCLLIDPQSDQEIANINTPEDWQENITS
jgi:cyclic pyranopterin phosphate synthase